MAKKIAKNMSVKDYERLGRTLESIFESGYVNSWRVYRINFIRGVFFGLGSAVGASIIIATLLWILSFFTELPFVGEIAESLRRAIDNGPLQ